MGLILRKKQSRTGKRYWMLANPYLIMPTKVQLDTVNNAQGIREFFRSQNVTSFECGDELRSLVNFARK